MSICEISATSSSLSFGMLEFTRGRSTKGGDMATDIRIRVVGGECSILCTFKNEPTIFCFTDSAGGFDNLRVSEANCDVEAI